jgi:hypothetical protein
VAYNEYTAESLIAVPTDYVDRRVEEPEEGLAYAFTPEPHGLPADD